MFLPALSQLSMQGSDLLMQNMGFVNIRSEHSLYIVLFISNGGGF
jgi:hypothetical protein